MEAKLDQMFVKIQEAYQDYQQFKGKFLAINEPIINKDLLNLKIVNVQKQKGRQDKLLSKIGGHETAMTEIKNNVATLKKQYKSFETALFIKQNEQSKKVMKDTL